MKELWEGGVTLLPLGALSGPLMAALPPSAAAVPLPSRLLDPDGSLRADRILADPLVGRGGAAEFEASPDDATIFITDRPLSTRECLRVMGLSCRRRRIAVVSAWGLESEEVTLAEAGGRTAEWAYGPGAGGEGAWDPDHSPGAPRRLRNLVLHELGHLRGLGHCTCPGCLMTPVREAKELDLRGDLPCEACSSTIRDDGGRPRSVLGLWRRRIRLRLGWKGVGS